MKPIRIQRKRTKGFKLSEAAGNGLPTVYVGRGSKWGNPYVVTNVNDRESCVNAFRRWIIPALDLSQLKGKNLACWCKTSDCCHADVLLEIANKD